MAYAITHNGRAIGPCGEIKDINGTPLGAENTAEYNRQLEAKEIEWLKTAPDKLMLYIRVPDKRTYRFTFGEGAAITTWPGTVVSSRCYVSERHHIGFGYNSYRRAIDCLIFGTRYTGWWMESSGDYCRLRKAKRQNDGAGYCRPRNT